MKTAILRGERYFGVEITSEGKLVVAERGQGRPQRTGEFDGAQSLREHIERENAHPHVCIKACGAAGLAVATALMPTPGIEVTLVSPRALAAPSDPMRPVERAEQLARLAERLF